MDTTRSLSDHCRELARQRLDAVKGAGSTEEWQARWTPPQHDYPFRWGSCWTQCTQYCVEDYEAEIGFWLEVLGLPSNAYAPDFAMFTSPDRAFFLAVVPAAGSRTPTPPDSLEVGFMIQDLPAVAAELERRGVRFEEPPTAPWDGSPMLRATLRTPAGVPVVLWCLPQSPAGGEETPPED